MIVATYNAMLSDCYPGGGAFGLLPGGSAFGLLPGGGAGAFGFLGLKKFSFFVSSCCLL